MKPLLLTQSLSLTRFLCEVCAGCGYTRQVVYCLPSLQDRKLWLLWMKRREVPPAQTSGEPGPDTCITQANCREVWKRILMATRSLERRVTARNEPSQCERAGCLLRETQAPASRQILAEHTEEPKRIPEPSDKLRATSFARSATSSGSNAPLIRRIRWLHSGHQRQPGAVAKHLSAGPI